MTFPRSHSNRTRTRSQIYPGPGLTPPPLLKCRVCYLSGVRSFSFFLFSGFLPIFFWLKANTEAIVFCSLPPWRVPFLVPALAPHLAFGGFKVLPSSLSTASRRFFSS